MKIIFRPGTRDLDTLLDVGYMRSLWDCHGAACVQALESAAGLRFKHAVINARCGRFPISHSGVSGREAMQLKMHDSLKDSDYRWVRWSDEELLCSITHELGHRLLEEYDIVLPGRLPNSVLLRNYEVHRLLYVFLYDAWQLVFGPAQAKQMQQEDERGATPEYKAAWKWARGLTPQRRKQLIRFMRQHKYLPGQKHLLA